MAVLTVSDLAERLAVDNQYLPGMHDTVFRNDDGLIGRIIPLRGYKAGTYVRINAITSANSSVEVYTEGQAVPARGKQTVITSKFQFKHFRGLIGETGHARRERGVSNEGLRDSDPEWELQMCMRDIKDLMTTTFITDSVTYSIRGIIDTTTTNWGDASRTTYATLISYILDASGADMSTSLMNKANWRCREAPYGAKVDLWISAPLQSGKIAELQSGKNYALGPQTALLADTPQASATQNWATLPDFGTSEVLGLTDVDGTWGYTSNESSPGGFHIRYFGSEDDSDTIQISTAGAIWCTQPQRQVKISGLSTG